jgi:outer membrane protein OmpA-like peptidoglycan-associated protein
MMKQMRLISMAFIVILASQLRAQEVYTCELAYGLNTANDDIATAMLDENTVLVTSNGVQDLINDYAWNKNNLFHMNSARMRNDFADWNAPVPLWYKHINRDEGPGSFNSRDSILFFCSTVNYDGAKGGFIKIYSIEKVGKSWGQPVLLPFCKSKWDYAHPYYNTKEDMLVFSSNMEGGQGGLDIWIVYLREGQWTEPLNLGPGVNTPANEVFPTMFQEDIYFASNQTGGLGGFDVFKALRKFQWGSSTALPMPFNSTADDMAALFVSEEKCLLTSNRSGGVGGDDIYVIQLPAKASELHDLVGRFYCQNQPMSGGRLTFKNKKQEIVHATSSGERGVLGIGPIRMNQTYRVELSGVDKELWALCALHIEDKNGNIIRVFQFNREGFLEMELLPFQHKELELWEFEDSSLLTIDLEGQLYETTPGDIKQGEPITILDEQGVPVAIAYTNDNGKFKFTDMEPQLSYNFVLADESRVKQILLTDKGQKIVLPVLNAEASYQRVTPEEAIALRNEFDQLIYVSPKDIFVINRIYYGYNSVSLTQEAMQQLNQLYLLMAKNPNFKVELFSHTDSRGSDVFNQRLSNGRAQAAVKYLIDRGIATSRLVPHGMGESRLVINCPDDNTCSEPEHSINRRTEIRLSRNDQ